MRRWRLTGFTKRHRVCTSFFGETFATGTSVHAIFDGRTMAPVAAKGRSEVHCAGPISRNSIPLEECGSAKERGVDSGSGKRASHHSGGVEARSEKESAGGLL